MTGPNETLRGELLAQIKSPQTSLPDYWADPSVQNRVGRVLAGASARMNGLGAHPTDAVLMTPGNNVRASPQETVSPSGHYDLSLFVWVAWFCTVMLLCAVGYWRFG